MHAKCVLLWATFGATLWTASHSCAAMSHALAANARQMCAAMSHVWCNSREDNCVFFGPHSSFPFTSAQKPAGSFGKFSKYIYFWNLEPYMLFSVRSRLGRSNLFLLEDNCAFFWAAFLFTTKLWHAKKKLRCLLFKTAGSEVSSTKKG